MPRDMRRECRSKRGRRRQPQPWRDPHRDCLAIRKDRQHIVAEHLDIRLLRHARGQRPFARAAWADHGDQPAAMPECAAVKGQTTKPAAEVVPCQIGDDCTARPGLRSCASEMGRITATARN